MSYVRVKQVDEELKAAGLRDGFVYRAVAIKDGAVTVFTSLNGKFSVEVDWVTEGVSGLIVEPVTKEEVALLQQSLSTSKERKANMNAQVAGLWVDILNTSLAFDGEYTKAVGMADDAVSDFLDRIHDGAFQV